MQDQSGFALPEEIEDLRRAAARFAEKELAPAVRDAEKAGTWSPDVLAVLKGFSLRELDLPEDLGGVGAGSVAKVALLEALAMGDAAGLPAADQPGASMGALVACPDHDLAQEVAAACISGDAQAPLVVADPEVAQPIRIEWTPVWPPLRWAWITRGDALRLVKVTVSAEPTRALAFQASGGASADITHCEPLGEWMLKPGAGVNVRGRARLWAAAVAVGVAQSAFDATIAYTTQRVVFGKPVAYHQGNAFELAGAATNLHGARLMVRDAAAAYDRDDAYAGFWATQAWLGAIDVGVTVTDLGIQLLGGHGFLVDHLAEKRFREARMLGLIAGGRDAAVADVAALALDVPDPIFATQKEEAT
jgi:alkylation response protein AidB-like acyl-CoA dehydrogenase